MPVPQLTPPERAAFQAKHGYRNRCVFLKPRKRTEQGSLRASLVGIVGYKQNFPALGKGESLVDALDGICCCL